MDIDLPAEWSALCLLVFALGARHGLDADHLAAIDGMTRFNARVRPGLARVCGTLFSVGHGAVVVTIALTVSAIAGHWQAPAWLEVSGSLVSIVILTGLGFVNLYAVLNTAPDEVVQPIGLRGRFLGRLLRVDHPAAVMAVGAMFALSFDTVSQALLFALTAEQFGGWRSALLLGLLFMSGMLLTDGINGFWISRLIRRADQTARIASRAMGLVVAILSLAVAGFSLAKWSLPAIDAWGEGKDLALGMGVISVIAASFLFAMWLARRPISTAR
ncbi:MAG: nickel transporter [Rhodocyclales bacterium]|nr:nickel transporter [Rhodocyclales bacterium]